MEYRDLQYEQSNIADYDCHYPEGGIKCKNYELCQHNLSPDWFILYGNYLCPSCDGGSLGFGWRELEFKESGDECVVCNETGNKQLKFPANCGHWFCVSCSRKLLFWDESLYHLSPVVFGCPPCPNDCINPVKGKQCYCVIYDEILERWKQENPDKFEEYYEAEILSIFSPDTTGCVIGSRKCPLCRKNVNKFYIKN